MRTSGRWLLENPTKAFAWAGLLIVIVGLAYHKVNPATIIDTAVKDYREAEERGKLVDDHVRLGLTQIVPRLLRR